MAGEMSVSTPRLLSVRDGLISSVPAGAAHDFSQRTIGRGARDFAIARAALSRWRQVDLGWVRVLNPDAVLAPGQLVCVQAHVAFLWSINFCRIVETVDEPNRFGFVYATTKLHVERGEERFIVELDAGTDSISYSIEAISRPNELLARIAYPYARALQRRFTRDSLEKLYDILERER
jgi:uncharacterized protein (UPF0548 family)